MSTPHVSLDRVSIRCVSVSDGMRQTIAGGLLTSAEAAALGGVSKMTILRAVRAGKLSPFRTPGGHFRFRRADIEELLLADPAKASA